MSPEASADTSAGTSQGIERVVLLHGLARTRFSMWPLERALQRAGYETLNVGYPSTRRAPDDLVAFLHQRIGAQIGALPRSEPTERDTAGASAAKSRSSGAEPGTVGGHRKADRKPTKARSAPELSHAGDEPDSAPATEPQPAVAADRVHFVTHSLGGVLLRAYLSRYEVPRLGRIVQLTPPNQGSEIVDKIGAWRLFGWIFGPTGRSLGTGEGSLPRRLVDSPTAEVGVIAGSRSLNPLGNALLPGPGDGAVTLERTRFADGGETDWIALPIDHTTIMQRRATAEQVIHFLRSGSFQHEAPPPVS